MTYKETIDYLFSQLPMFQRIGAAAYKANLDNTLALSRHLGKPETTFRSIHIAGTNGKGSVSHMLASVLQEQGYRTGLATSPHFTDFRERIKIDGKMIPEDPVVRFVSKHKAFFEQIKPSFFEMTMAMTFHWFAEQKVDIAVVETGMGGRLDSSNIITPELAVITNIGYDHVRFLGPGIQDIAREKAGIIKQAVPVIIGKRQTEVQDVFAEIAARQKAPLTVASDHYVLKKYMVIEDEGKNYLRTELQHEGNTETFDIGLLGLYQTENLVTSLAACDILNRGGKFFLSERAIRKGLKFVVENTGIKGRWQQIGSNPRVICDTGHNADGIDQINRQLKAIPHKKLLMVFGMVDDKDLPEILKRLPREALYYFCRPAVPRGLDARKLATDAGFFGLNGRSFDSVNKALAAAKKDATADDLIFVGGSTFVVAEVL
ncbi:MAG: bifunctional folylpolyglutamate synthase/dihydrofolate synthase [Bacteroidia bacterium]|nr:MAG: bifunctional folylpolyglutamate synthase/dihydrofolate synthase [Bacteroidia bacterium]